MESLAERLERGEALLQVIDRSREEAGDPFLAANIEHMLIDRVIQDFEADARRSRIRSPYSPDIAVIEVGPW